MTDQARALTTAVSGSRSAGAASVIAEVKRVIPSGKIAHLVNTLGAARIAELFFAGGATAISVVAERKHFGGFPENDIPTILSAVPLPLLVKDFISSVEQVEELAEITRGWGAEGPRRCGVLLIAHQLKDRLHGLAKAVRKCEMEPIIEVRDVAGLRLAAGVPSLGTIVYNNKNIDILEIDIDGIRLSRGFIEMAQSLIPNVLVVSASGHRDVADVTLSVNAGADAVLVGTAILTASNPCKLMAEIVAAARIYHPRNGSSR